MSLRIMAPIMTLGGFLASAKQCLNARPQAVFVVATMAGIYNALRKNAWPALDM
jgi:hypothetical protein